ILSGVYRYHYSYPTRRSSYLVAEGLDESTATKKGLIDAATVGLGVVLPAARIVKPILGDAAAAVGANVGLGMAGRGATAALLERSEEHTSELQSRENLVCRLL